MRRDKIIREVYMDCRLYKGQEVVHHDPKKRDDYGKSVVRGVAKNVIEYGDTQWKEDNPFIVLVSTEHKGEIVCTYNYFIPASEGNNGGSC
jgi:hypothetical protein